MIKQDVYNNCDTLVGLVSARAWGTVDFQVRVGLHQESALSLLLFILIMDVLFTGRDWKGSTRSDVVLRMYWSFVNIVLYSRS